MDIVPKFYLGDVVQTKRSPAEMMGSCKVGADIRIKCLSTVISAPRRKFEKSVKKVLQRGEE